MAFTSGAVPRLLEIVSSIPSSDQVTVSLFVIICSLSAKPPSDYLTPIGGGNIEMEENVDVTSQSGQHVPLSGDSENVYTGQRIYMKSAIYNI